MYEVHCEGQVVKCADHDAAYAAAGKFYAQGKKPEIKTVGVEGGDVSIVAKDRIDAQQAAMKKAGFTGIGMGESSQAYANGTRMTSGYAVQDKRKAEFDALLPLRDVADKLSAQVKAEGRRDVEMTARDVADSINISKTGAITIADGYRITEQAMRGLMPRIESPALGYLLGLRDRYAEVRDTRDRTMIAEVLRRELMANPDVELKLRTRHHVGDVFAIVSPKYAPADAPETLAQIADQLPRDAKGSFAYDAKSTAWELRAQVWTPTPVSEQAVGEAFNGYAALGGRDAGNGSVYGSGGCLMLRCLNATTYAAEFAKATRVHRGNVMLDVETLFANAKKAIDALCEVWGVARETTVPEAPTVEGIKLAREIALAGYFRGMLSDRKSELAGVLPGRTEQHIEKLMPLYDSERRDAKKLVKADLAQAFTRYVQGFDADVQRDAEFATGQWLANEKQPSLLVKQ